VINLQTTLTVLLSQTNQKPIKTNLTSQWQKKPNDKKCKAKPKKNDSNMPAPRKPCMLHGPNSSYMTDNCQTLQEQASQMKETWKKYLASRTLSSEMQAQTTKTERRME
jgi:hypothetical protein